MISQVSNFVSELSRKVRLRGQFAQPKFDVSSRILPVSILDVSGASGLAPVVTETVQHATSTLTNPGAGVGLNLAFPGSFPNVYDCIIDFSLGDASAFLGIIEWGLIDVSAAWIQKNTFMHSGTQSNFTIKLAYRAEARAGIRVETLGPIIAGTFAINLTAIPREISL